MAGLHFADGLIDGQLNVKSLTFNQREAVALQLARAVGLKRGEAMTKRALWAMPQNLNWSLVVPLSPLRLFLDV